MAFDPEGQPGSSQARSAWVAMQRAPAETGFENILRAEALIKLALMGLKPQAESWCPFGARNCLPHGLFAREPL
jgi:hypothetical protein